MTSVPDKYTDLLDKKGFAHVATIGKSGEPQSSPVWYGYDGEHILFSQTTSRIKLKNLKRDPRIALSITDPENPYRYLEIRGEVVDVSDDPEFEFIDSMAKKYMDKDKYPFHQPGDVRVVVKVRPTNFSAMG